MLLLQITPSERAILECLASGAALSEIAHRVGINEHQIDAPLQ